MTETKEQIMNRLNDLESKKSTDVKTRSIQIDNSRLNYTTQTFSPIPTNGNWIWLDAADTSTVSTESSTVTEWRDKSPNQYVFTRASDTLNSGKPTYSLSSLNNLPTLSFDRVTKQYLIGDENSRKFEVGYNSFYLFIVFKFNEASTEYFQGVFNKSLLLGVNGRIACYKGYGTAYPDMYLDITQPEASTGSPFVMNDTNFNIFTLICHRNTPGEIRSTSTINQNGTTLTATSFTRPISTGETIHTNLTNTQYMFVGAYNSETSGSSSPKDPSFLHGSIAEIIGYSTEQDMSTLNIQRVEGYLAWKWGLNAKLPTNHPYKNKSPNIL